jgi:hypothetical protein
VTKTLSRTGGSSSVLTGVNMLRENWYVLIDEDNHSFSVVGPALDDGELYPRWHQAYDEDHRNVRMYGVRTTETRDRVMANAQRLGYRFSESMTF